MAGLQNQNNNSNRNASVLSKWYHLFNSRTNRTVHAYEHWQSLERLWRPSLPQLESLFAYRDYVAPPHIPVSAKQRDKFSMQLDAFRLVFVDGYFVSALSDIDTGRWQFTVEVEPCALPAPIKPEVFLHLTESLSNEIIRISLPAGKKADKPLYLLHMSHGGCANTDTLSTMHYRNHIEIADGAYGQLIEHFISLDSTAHASGARTTITVSDNAYLSYMKLAFENQASYHFAHNDIRIGCDAVVRSSTFLLGARFTRHQTSAQLNGECSDLLIHSLLLPSASGEEMSETSTYLEHNKGYCRSRQLHKIIVRDRGKGGFNGLLKVTQQARKTNGQMTNHNLLLDALASVNTKPQLEIYADDVKCRHRATVGGIDDGQMFYLRSRGIPYHDAKQLIVAAFASELTEPIGNDAVRDSVLALLAELLRRTAR